MKRRVVLGLLAAAPIVDSTRPVHAQAPKPTDKKAALDQVFAEVA